VSNNTIAFVYKGKRLNNNLSLADNNVIDGATLFQAGDIGQDIQMLDNRMRRKKKKKRKGKSKKRRRRVEEE